MTNEKYWNVATANSRRVHAKGEERLNRKPFDNCGQQKEPNKCNSFANSKMKEIERRTCFSCGRSEHLIRDCPEKMSSIRRAKSRRNNDDSDEEVVLMNNQNGYEVKNLIAEQGINGEGVGEAIKKAEDGKRKFYRLKSQNAFYILQLQHNLLSISKSMSQDNVDVEFAMHCCYINGLERIGK
ncbi:hypothetical protein ROZALSC1DRAFT_21020 [Rozella allomycis CSF55]|uniref:CCHC-type domain-containing protein n=1 Tax=Rozella allomycis (strain CSF55) TaxID=988480 RepID=A0A4P9YME1_ROZAC|nr:hypothetical protein ROZALSC1DRAFT_21020 [Rozella allomycis CSF55]